MLNPETLSLILLLGEQGNPCNRAEENSAGKGIATKPVDPNSILGTHMEERNWFLQVVH